jgi:hypothetical protein
MTRSDWLLLLLGLDAPPAGPEPVRVQKAMFLLAQEGGIPPAERYWFVPYNYGPMSPRIYRDVDGLVRRGLLERVPVPGYTWGRVRATPAGAARAAALAETASPGDRPALDRLAEIRSLVTALDFADLLSTIYARYPAYARRSVFRRRPR